ncbi:hypothetical protein Leryth_015122 [Lithospermum erythrorhizon]|nr:hypothetical protein Leryth_015122 [Lithospermum erythrorhizon]
MATLLQQQHHDNNQHKSLLHKYLGLSFTLFLGSLPKNASSFVPNLQTHNKDLNFKLNQAQKTNKDLNFMLFQAQEEVKKLNSRRKEDSKANARVVEIFAGHRNAWQQEEKRLLMRIDECDEEIDHLRGQIGNLEKLEGELRVNVEELRREISERDEMLNFMSQRCCEMGNGGELGVDFGDLGLKYGKSWVQESGDLEGVDECFGGNGRQNMEEFSKLYGHSNNGFAPELLNSASKFWSERSSLYQDVQYESRYNTKHFVARRESPWKVDGQSTGVSSKLKLLEQELLNLETVGKTDMSTALNMRSKLKDNIK